jgi:adenosylmethionine-8-amino-7-oxononanoate aminotransferase
MSETEPNYNFYIAKRRLPIVDHAEGIKIWDTDGKEYIDACSGAVISNIGYGQASINKAIQEQADKTFFAYRLHFENQPALDYSKALVAHSAAHLDRVFFVSGGSEGMSAKMMAASRSKALMGCMVTSAANSGVLMSSKMLYFSRKARYSAI